MVLRRFGFRLLGLVWQSSAPSDPYQTLKMHLDSSGGPELGAKNLLRTSVWSQLMRLSLLGALKIGLCGFLCWDHQICTMEKNLEELGSTTVQVLYLVSYQQSMLDGRPTC